MRALNASSLLLAYQAELQEEMTTTPTSDLWDELCVVTDLCLCLRISQTLASPLQEKKSFPVRVHGGMFQPHQKMVVSAVTTHSCVNRRKIGPAESSVEPQQSPKSTHHCTRTQQYHNTHFPPSLTQNSLKFFSGTQPGLEPRAQPQKKLKKEKNTKVFAGRKGTVPLQMRPLRGAMAPPVAQQANPSPSGTKKADKKN